MGERRLTRCSRLRNRSRRPWKARALTASAWSRSSRSSRRAPARAKADLLDTYIDALGDLNNALHGDVTLNTAIELHGRALTTVSRLFGPMTARLTEIDALAAIGDPAVQDVEQLAGLAGDPRVMDYFFSRVDGPGWLHALGEHQLLQPPAESIWSAFRYLMALASTHPEDTRTWLQSRPRGRDLNAGQARALLTVARTVKEQVADAVLRIVETHTTDVAVLHGIAGYLETLAEDEHSSEAVIGLLKRALAGALGAGSSADDSYLAAGMLRVAVSSASQAHPGRWLAILAAKFAQIADPPNPFQFRRLEAIGGLGLEAGAPVYSCSSWPSAMSRGSLARPACRPRSASRHSKNFRRRWRAGWSRCT